MRVVSFVSFLLVGAAYGGPTTHPACLTRETNDLCQFPFNYKGVIYDKCTYVETINNQPWCATVPEVNVTREGKVLFKSQVGDCDLESNCEVEDECQGKPCGELCGLGVCDGNGFCVNPEENPCEQHGCEGKSCGEDCLLGDILGSCDIDGNCDFDTGKAIASCNEQGSFDECKFKTCGELCQTGVCDGHGFCVDVLENPCVQHGCGGKQCGEECLSGDIFGNCDINGDCDFRSRRAINSCEKQGLFAECAGKPCGEGCESGICDGCGGVCDGNGLCVNAEENPCELHGCQGKSCGEECLQGDIIGTCDSEGDCNFDIYQAIDSCNKTAEDCSSDTLVRICSCHRLANPVCADGESYGNLCIYQCAKKKAACQGQLDFPELEECNAEVTGIIDDSNQRRCRSGYVWNPRRGRCVRKRN